MYTYKTKAATLCEQPIKIRLGGERVRWSFFFLQQEGKESIEDTGTRSGLTHRYG